MGSVSFRRVGRQRLAGVCAAVCAGVARAERLVVEKKYNEARPFVAALQSAPGLELQYNFLGGMIALDFAARRPDRVEALALACTTAGFGAAGGRRQREYLARRLDPLDAGRTMADIAALEIPSMMHPPADPALVARLGDLMATIPPAAYAAATRALTGFDRRAAIAELTMPVLCIAGGHDRIAPPEVLASMARRAPQGRSSMLVQTGHLAPFEAPGRFVALLDGFAMSAGEAAR